ncbi:23937_t:CDS:2, partial [Gigaspora rosea]
NIDLDLENISLDNLQFNANTDNQQSRSPSIELQSRQNYNENLQNQNNKTSQIHDPQKYYNSIRSLAHSSFDASTYQHKAPSQTNKRSIALSIEPGIDSSSKRPDRHSSNQNHHYYFTDEDESSSEDELFSSLDQHNDSNSFKESHSTALLNMQNTHLIRWLEARKDIVLQVLNSICSSPIPTKRTRTSLIKGDIPNMVKTHPDWNGISTKLRQAFENFLTKLNQILHSNPSNRDIEEFIAGAVWEKPLKKHIDILDYDVFKNQQSSVKVLKTFIAKSLKIHLEYLIAESKGEDPNYNSMVLNCIKGLDNIPINTTFPAA